MAPRITYWGHARRRMRQRKVSERDVEVTLSAPDIVELTPKPSRRYMRTMQSGRTLKVWVDLSSTEEHIIVRSVAWRGEEDE